MRGVYGTGRPKLTDQDRLFIVIALRIGYSLAEIGRFMDVSPKTVYNIRETYLA